MKTTPVLRRTGWLHKSFVYSLLMVGLLYSMATFVGCTKDNADVNGPTGGTATQTTTIYGRIVDESGKSVAGATVSAGTYTTTSDANGLFVIKNANVPKGRAIVLAKKSGYFTAARAASPGAAGTTRVELSMMNNTAQYNVPASSGGKVTVTGSNGAAITFQGGSFQTSSGAAYSGTVNVAAKYLNPASPTFANFFAGDNTAQTSDGSIVSLTSCGVLRVELTGSSGEVLKLDASKPATITYPKTADVNAPASMPLWYFDETLGMWKEDGSATLSGTTYTGTVTHFTDWNLDYKGESGELELRVVCGSIPVAGVAVKIFQRIGYTDMDGKVGFLRVPADQNVQIEITSADNNGVYYINNPIPVAIQQGQRLNLGDVSLNSPCPASLTGHLVDCSENTKIEGLVTITDGNKISYVYTKTGDFSVQTVSGAILTVSASDPNGNNSLPVTVPALSDGESRDMGNIQICGTNTSSFIDITPSGASANSYAMLALSPDGSLLAANGYEQKNPKLEIFNTTTGQSVCTITLSAQTYISTMEISADNKKLLARTYNNAIVFDITGATATQLCTLACGDAHLYDDGSKMMASVYDDPTQTVSFGIYSTADASLIKKLSASMGSGAPGTKDSMAVTFGFSHEEEAVVYPKTTSITNTSYSVWGASGDAELRNFSDNGPTWYTYYSEDGATMCASSNGTDFAIYDTKTGTKINAITPYKSGTGSRFGQLTLTKNNAYSGFSSNGVGIIQITKLSDGSATLKMVNSEYVSSIVASRSENYLAAATSGKIRVWQLK